MEVRSKARVGEELPSDSDEYNFAWIMNSVLPPDIRVMGWAPVTEEFNAR